MCKLAPVYPTYWIIKLENDEIRIFFFRIQIDFGTNECLDPFATLYYIYAIKVTIKTKVKNRLELKNDFSVCVSNTELRFEELISEKQAYVHLSHYYYYSPLHSF